MHDETSSSAPIDIQARTRMIWASCATLATVLFVCWWIVTGSGNSSPEPRSTTADATTPRATSSNDGTDDTTDGTTRGEHDRDADLARRAAELTQPPLVHIERAATPAPHWIWSSSTAGENQTVWLRKRIEMTSAPRQATLRFTADNHAIVRIDGREVGAAHDWTRPQQIELGLSLPFDDSSRVFDLVVEARNDGGPGAFLAVLELVDDSGERSWVVSGDDWEAADDEEFLTARAAVDLGPLGTAPWGSVPGFTGADLDRSIAVVEGFDVELVHTVTPDQGSWVCLTTDGKGRLIAGDQYGGLFRITPAHDGTTVSVEPIDVAVGGAQGLLCVDDDLYCVTNGKYAEGSGLYRVRDTDGDDQYDSYELLRALPGSGGEHGRHGIVLGADGMLYIVAGNHTPLPELAASTVPRVWGEDHLLPRLWDAGGHAVGILAPGGWICRTDRDGRSWELIAAGLRNAYDIAFHRDDELFTYDADMEWDLGSPWYRPTRLHHVASGAEFGWRSGTAKWPPHYRDSLPSILDIGPGSPTGIVFGYGSAFPERYHEALFLLDWTFGTIYSVHLEAQGASYRARREIFLTGRPLPVTDAVVLPDDGCLYFTVGGRRVASALYRVRHVGGAVAIRAAHSDASPERDLRRRLEEMHRDGTPAEAVDFIWPHLGSSDRFIRYAARVALEHQPAERWANRIESSGPRHRLAACLALARVGGRSPDKTDGDSDGDAADGTRAAALRDTLHAALDELAWTDLDSDLRLELLRCRALAFIRMGAPAADLRQRLIRQLDAAFPAGDDRLDRELCDLLVYLGSPRVVADTIALMENSEQEDVDIDRDLLLRGDSYGQAILKMAAAPPQRQQTYYALALRNAGNGWTDDLRSRYFRWFEQARYRVGGNSFRGFLEAIRKDALAAIDADQRHLYEDIGRTPPPGFDATTLPRGPGRTWTVDALTTLAEDGGLTHRDFERGEQLYAGAMCFHCHRLGTRGAAGGPDLTGVGSRFSLRDLVEAIVEPSNTVSDQYAHQEFVLQDDSVIIGRVLDEDDDVLRVRPSMLAPESTVEITKERVRQRRPSRVSPMMPDLLVNMAPGEALDLLAYVLAGGDRRSAMHAPRGAGDPVDLFDGASLDGWVGDARFWSIEEGSIVGRTTPETPLDRNAYLRFERDLPRDFELRFDVRISGDNNSGVQYRSIIADDAEAVGYQCDIHVDPAAQASLYEVGGRALLAANGERVRLHAGGERTPLALAAAAVDFGVDHWRTYTIIARGKRLEHRVDGTVTCVVIDDVRGTTPPGAQLALQLHGGTPFEVRFRNIRMRELPPPTLRD